MDMKSFAGKIYKSERGAVLLIAVLVITMVVLLLSFTINSNALDDLKTSMKNREGSFAESLAESCFEEVLIKLKEDSNYTIGQIVFEEGQCQVAITSEGSIKSVNILAEKDNYFTEVNAEVDLSVKPIKISLWKKGL